MNILVADDALYIREKMRNFFKDLEQITLYEASNGQEALNYIKKNNIDLIIIDSVMPIKSGIQVIKESKKIAPKILAFGLTTQECGSTRNKFLDAGAKDILKKPFTSESLHTLLREYI